MGSASIEIEVDEYLHMASTKALIKELTHRKEARDEVIVFANKEDWYEIDHMDWYKLANLIAEGEIREALEFVEYISNGVVNAISAINYNSMFNRIRAARLNSPCALS